MRSFMGALGGVSPEQLGEVYGSVWDRYGGIGLAATGLASSLTSGDASRLVISGVDRSYLALGVFGGFTS